MARRAHGGEADGSALADGGPRAVAACAWRGWTHTAAGADARSRRGVRACMDAHTGDLDDDALSALVHEDTLRQLAGASAESSGLTCLKHALDGFCVTPETRRRLTVA